MILPNRWQQSFWPFRRCYKGSHPFSCMSIWKVSWERRGKAAPKNIRFCAASVALTGSQSWPKRMTTTRSSSDRIAWSTCQPSYKRELASTIDLETSAYLPLVKCGRKYWREWIQHVEKESLFDQRLTDYIEWWGGLVEWNAIGNAYSLPCWKGIEHSVAENALPQASYSEPAESEHEWGRCNQQSCWGAELYEIRFRSNSMSLSSHVIS